VRADIRGNTVPTTAAFDLLAAQLIYYEYDAAGGHGIGQLVDTGAASATATAQLQSTNTGTSQASDPGGTDGGDIQLIPGPINTPP
jgi:hypothetical protein